VAKEEPAKGKAAVSASPKTEDAFSLSWYALVMGISGISLAHGENRKKKNRGIGTQKEPSQLCSGGLLRFARNDERDWNTKRTVPAVLLQRGTQKEPSPLC